MQIAALAPVCLAGGLLLAGSPAHAQHATADDIADGQRAFAQNCAICHGPDGNLIAGIDFGRGLFRRAYTDEERAGTYRCVCCGDVLFTSKEKYHSGCGWPSFFRKADGANIRELDDTSYGMRRIEVRCGSCDAHLGHVFPDGPRPSGLRYCMNAVALHKVS